MSRTLSIILVSVVIATGMQGCVRGRMPWEGKHVEDRFHDVVDEASRINRKHPNQTNPLEIAIIDNDSELALFIVSHYPHYVFVLNSSGWSNLFNAVNAKNIPVMRALLKAGAIKVRAQSSPLICAVSLSSEAAKYDKTEEPKCLLMVHELLTAGADVNKHDSATGVSPLFAARNARLAALLIARGADVNAAPAGGITPLMLAAFDGDVERTKLLLDHGANPYRRASEDGATALSCARQEGHHDIVALLETYMKRHPPIQPVHGK